MEIENFVCFGSKLPYAERQQSARNELLAIIKTTCYGKRPTMGKLSLSGLEAEFRSLVKQLDVEPYYKAFHTSPQHDGTPHVEMKSGKFEFVVTERGLELERISGLDNDEVLYLLFAGITSIMATSYELRNRKPTGDGRAVWFPYQEKLMADLRPSWGLRLKVEHEQIVQKFPFGQ